MISHDPDSTLNIVCPVSVLIGSQFSIGSGAVGIIGLLSCIPGGGGGTPPGTGGGGGGAAGIDGGGGGGGGIGIVGEAGRGVALSTSLGITMLSAFSSPISDLMSSSFFCNVSKCSLMIRFSS